MKLNILRCFLFKKEWGWQHIRVIKLNKAVVNTQNCFMIRKKKAEFSLNNSEVKFVKQSKVGKWNRKV